MFTRIFVPINLTDASSWTQALPVAISLAQAGETRLTLATILPHWVSARDADWSWEADRRLEDVACQRLRRIAKQCGCEDCNLEAVWGSVRSSVPSLDGRFQCYDLYGIDGFEIPRPGEEDDAARLPIVLKIDRVRR